MKTKTSFLAGKHFGSKNKCKYICKKYIDLEISDGIDLKLFNMRHVVLDKMAVYFSKFGLDFGFYSFYSRCFYFGFEKHFSMK